MTALEAKLRRTQEEKIDLEEQVSKNKIKQTMEGYKSLQNEHNEKNRIRELETQLAAERTRLESDRKIISEKTSIIEEFKSKLIEYENR